MAKDVIIALDFPEREDALTFLKKFSGERPFIKIGMELFYSAGPELVRELSEHGYKIFLDLKLHDIPNTVSRSARVLGGLGAAMINVHASGGAEMMSAAREALGGGRERPLLIAVTQLTSTSPEMLRDELLIGAGMEDTVLRYAENARKSGLDGVVCSPLESAAIKSACGEDFLTVTPGIRFGGVSPLTIRTQNNPVGQASEPASKLSIDNVPPPDDQKRVSTPSDAHRAGADYIVVGRPITAADDPLAAYERCAREFFGGA